MRYLTNIDLYETPSRLYAIGQLSTNTTSSSYYRILKLDRTLVPPLSPCHQLNLNNFNNQQPLDHLGLQINDDNTCYTSNQVQNVLNMLTDSNDSIKLIAKDIIALLGITRFTEAYYLIAVVQATQVAQLGPHIIYRVDETRLISIANPVFVKWPKTSDETHYVSAFQTVALQQDLYFSLSYDLTRSLQHNILARALQPKLPQFNPSPSKHASPSHVHDLETLNYLCSACSGIARRAMGSTNASPCLRNDGMFTWNAHHLVLAALGLGINLYQELCTTQEQPSPWFLPIIQGFVGQVKLTVVGRPIFITLIARRSRKYAGARYLRRGIDLADGWVANEVESEQIVHDGAQTSFPYLKRTAQQRLRRSSRQSIFQHPCSASSPFPATFLPPNTPNNQSMPSTSSSHQPTNTSSILDDQVYAQLNNESTPTCPFCYGNGISTDGTVRTEYPPGPLPRTLMYTSFLQHRGSIPLIWSQDTSSLTPKPSITLNIRDPYYVLAGKHFNRMFEHYGPSVICFNLVKTREKSKREMILGDEFACAIAYLKQFLNVNENLQYYHVDMSLEAKAGRVIDVLEQHAKIMVDRIGIFASSPEPVLQARIRNSGDYILARVQNGVVRTNCIDCLDRTNTAAFMIGKCALGRQLMHLGIVKSAVIPFDTEVIDLLTELYQEHGDAIAIQYGGSALVNTMKTYRDRTFISQSRDMLESAKRYWSNSFSDADKQDAIDIFLGVYDRWGDFRSGHVPIELNLSPGPWNYTRWRVPNTDPILGHSDHSGEDMYPEPCQHVSLADIYGAGNCVMSQSATPFKPHEPRTETMFDLSGLKKWLSVRQTGPLFSREQISTGFSTVTSVGYDNAKNVTFTHVNDSIDSDVVQTPNGFNMDESSRPRYQPTFGGSGQRMTHTADGADSATTYFTGSPNYVSEHTKVELNESQISISKNKKKKKAIEHLCNKLLAPEVSHTELREYKRYVHQFQSPILERQVPMFQLDQVQLHTNHPDCAVFQQHVTVGASTGNGPIVAEDDISLYHAYVDVPKKVARATAAETMNGDLAPTWQVQAYTTWLTTGRLKPMNPSTK